MHICPCQKVLITHTPVVRCLKWKSLQLKALAFNLPLQLFVYMSTGYKDHYLSARELSLGSDSISFI